KAVIMIFLPGGPSHQDIFDLKMDAPREVRGEFKPIPTNVAGIQITEHLPRLARMMDKCTLIRSMSDCDGRHDAFQCLTGRPFQQQAPGGWPAFGSVVSKLQGALDPAGPPFVGLDTFGQQGFGVLTSSKLLQALDVTKEDPRILARYGKGDSKNRDDGGPKMMEHFLAARRLVEAGARCVTVAFSRWDHHGGNFGALRQDLPLLDQGVSALIRDLHDRGLDKDVSVVMWGEFGRTPTINKDGGRDPWPRVSW